MVLRLEDKKTIVAEVSAVAAKASSAIAAEYRGLSVAAMTELRNKARASGVYLKVVRNTLAKRAFKDTPFVCMQDELVGPLVLALSFAEPGAAARIMREFGKGRDKFVVKVIALNGKLLAPKDLEVLASLPNREEGLAMLMSVMQAPITKFVRTLVAPHTKLVRTIAAIRDQKQASE